MKIITPGNLDLLHNPLERGKISMNKTGKESLCTECDHREVCALKTEYQHIAELANDIDEEMMSKMHFQLHSVPWVQVRPPIVTCDYYKRWR